jgi:3-phosphoshikimate 1-carboxyvinyltransferase
MRALSGSDFPIKNLSADLDVVTLERFVRHPKDRLFDLGQAETAYPYLLALLVLHPYKHILAGSPRLWPYSSFIKVLNHLGADVRYLAKEGQPPLHVGSSRFRAEERLILSEHLPIEAIEALLCLGPVLPGGLCIQWKQFTKEDLRYLLHGFQQFALVYEWLSPQTLYLPPQTYPPLSQWQVEADWALAAPFFLLAALSEKVNLRIQGLFPHSPQPESVLVAWFKPLGVQAHFTDEGLVLTKDGEASLWPAPLCLDLKNCPRLWPCALSLALFSPAGLVLQGLDAPTKAILQQLEKELAVQGLSFCWEEELRLRYLPKEALNLDCQQNILLSLFVPVLRRFLQGFKAENTACFSAVYPQFAEECKHLGLC